MTLPVRLIIGLLLVAAITILLSVVLIAIIDPSIFPGIWHLLQSIGNNPLGRSYP